MATDAIPDSGLFGGTSQLLDLLGKVFGTQSNGVSTTTNELDPHTSDILTQFLSTVMPELTSDQYSPAAAERDSKGAIDNLFRQYRESIPAILGGSNSAGAYNSSTTQLLANDAFARTSAQAAQNLLDTKTKYAGIQNNSRSQIVNLLLGLLAATKKTTTTDSKTNNAATNAAKNAALAAGALKGLLGNNSKKPANNGKSPSESSSPGSKDSSVDDAVQNQLDRENGEPSLSNPDDITSQIIDGLTAADFGADPLENIADPGAPDSSALDTPDFDFSDAFTNFDFGDNSGDTSGDTGDSGDSGDSGDTSDGTEDNTDFGDPFGGGSVDDEEGDG